MNRMPFSKWSVGRILAGAKTQTRRLMKPQPLCPEWAQSLGQIAEPRYKVGEVVAMGEALVKSDYTGDVGAPLVAYEDGELVVGRETGSWLAWAWKPKKLAARYMPLWAARRWHRIADVRAERMLDISEEDALAEGLVHDESRVIGTTRLGTPMRSNWQASDGEWYSDRVVAWVTTIRHHHPKLEPEDNPWLWAYTFEQVDPVTALRGETEQSEEAER